MTTKDESGVWRGLVASCLIAVPLLTVAAIACQRDTITHEDGVAGADATELTYDPEAKATVRGTIMRIDSFQRIERSRFGVRVLVATPDEAYWVYLGPAMFLDERGIQLEKGQELRVSGSLHDGGGHRVIIAETMGIDGGAFTLRSESGEPEWPR